MKRVKRTLAAIVHRVREIICEDTWNIVIRATYPNFINRTATMMSELPEDVQASILCASCSSSRDAPRQMRTAVARVLAVCGPKLSPAAAALLLRLDEAAANHSPPVN